MSAGAWTFSLVNVIFLGAAGTAWAVAALTCRGRGQAPSWKAAAAAFAVLALLTAVFDNLMISAGLFDYDTSKRLGLVLYRAPIEDFGYPLAAVVLLPALWHLLQGRTQRRAATGERATGSRLWQVVLASRPLSWVNTAFPFAAAYLFTTREVDARLLVGTAFFLIPYNLLMYGVNDVFDYESDRRNPRKGGAEGALLDKGLHRLTLVCAIVVPLPFVIWLVALGSLRAALVLLVVLFAVVAYSAPRLRFKERPVLDSATSSTHFVGPALYGFVLAGAQLGPAHALILGAFFCWGMASQAFGAVQDVTADRAGGLASVATVFGAARTVRLALTLWTLAAVLLLLTPWPGPVAAVLVVPYMALAWPYRTVSDEHSEQANAGWRRFLGANYAVGAALTQLLIGLWQLNA
ncbi:prenyltransferase [Gephyromycinifex aptenodytis]|uniref:prenyltransferase n=1 Tax=Gephyromycinifex aptenodytis TaxID=2716227 RepID=UPI0014475EB7|nr:prenyltransferase [Gephyromycinifex aptenodytis]